MEAKLQRRVQRYGWDRAAADYERLWQQPLAPARAALLAAAAPAAGERLLDVACGTGLVTFEAAALLGPEGSALGVDLSGEMIAAAKARCGGNTRFERMDAEALTLPDQSFDLALCALGLMYMPAPEQALAEMARVLRPGGRVAVAVWGQREACGWAPVFPIVDAEVESDVCPLFFRLGEDGALERALAGAGFAEIEVTRLTATLRFADEDEAADAALLGGPVALAWARFDSATRARVRGAYLAAIGAWRCGAGYAVPGEFVIGCGVTVAV